VEPSNGDSDSDRANKELRREFFISCCGAKDPADGNNISTIVGLVNSEHSQGPGSRSITSLSREDLISHALYLFRNQREGQETPNFYVATQSGKVCPASTVYFEILKFDDIKLDVEVLHDKYLELAQIKERNEFENWLERRLGVVHSPPRLIRQTDWTHFEISPEMEQIIETCKAGPLSKRYSDKLLNLFKDHWISYYARWLVVDEKADFFFRYSQTKILEYIGTIPVRLQNYGDDQSTSEMDEEELPLQETILPSLSMKNLTGRVALPFLAIPGPEEEIDKWSFLLNLGVKVIDVPILLECLVMMRDGSTRRIAVHEKTPPSLDVVASIYYHIHTYCLDNEGVAAPTR